MKVGSCISLSYQDVASPAISSKDVILKHCKSLLLQENEHLYSAVTDGQEDGPHCV